MVQELVPPRQVKDIAQRMQISSSIRAVDSIALGTSEVKTIEIVASYATFANKGIYSSPIAITRIEDKYGRIIKEYSIDQKDLFEAGEKYYECATSLFLDIYLETAQSNALDIGYNPEVKYLLKYHMLEKAIYELGYELNARPDWLIIPLTGVFQLLNNENN